jgi:hypothetical protein
VSTLPDPPQVEKPLREELLKLKYQTELELAKAEETLINELVKLDYQHKLELAKAAETAEASKVSAIFGNDYAQQQAVLNAYIEVAKGLQTRAVTLADFVQKVAAAISSLYLGVVALSYGLAAGAEKLPASGIVPTVFLGFALFLATYYLAFITKPKPVVEQAPGSGDFAAVQKARRDNLIVWARNGLLQRRYALQASVISLGFGVLALPLPYLAVHPGVMTLFVLTGVFAVFVLPVMLVEE